MSQDYSQTEATPISVFHDLAKEALVAVQSALDSLFSQADAALPALNKDVLNAAVSVADELVPAVVRPVVVGVLNGALGSGHLFSEVNKFEAAMLGLAKARVDSTLAALESNL